MTHGTSDVGNDTATSHNSPEGAKTSSFDPNTKSKYNPLTHATAAVGAIKGVFGSSGSPRAVGESNAPAQNGSESTLSKYNPLTHATAAVGAIKGVFGSSGSPPGGESDSSAQAASESSLSKYNPLTYATSAVGAIKGVFGSSGSPSAAGESNAPAQNGSESTMSKYNPLTHATATVGAIKGVFGSSGSPPAGESDSSAEAALETSLSKYNPLTYATSAVGAIKGVFGSSGSSPASGESNATGQDASESSMSKYNPLGHATTAVGAIKGIFGSYSSPPAGESDSSAQDASGSSMSKYNPLTHATNAVGAIKGVFASYGSPPAAESDASAQAASESSLSKYNPLMYATAAVGAIKGVFRSSESLPAAGESNATAQDASESSMSKYNPVTNATTAVGANKGDFGSSGSPATYGESNASAQDPSESSVFKFNHTTHPIAAEGSIDNAIGSSGTTLPIGESSASAQDISESLMREYCSLPNATGVNKSVLGSSGFPDGCGESSTFAPNALESSIWKLNHLSDPKRIIGASSGTDSHSDDRNNSSTPEESVSIESKTNPAHLSSMDENKTLLGTSGVSYSFGETNTSASNSSKSSELTSTLAKTPIDSIASGTSGDELRNTSSADVPLSGNHSPAVTRAVKSIARAPRSSSVLLGTTVWSSATPVFKFNPSICTILTLLRTYNTEFCSSDTSPSGVYHLTNFKEMKCNLQGSKQLQNQETQTEHVSSENYDQEIQTEKLITAENYDVTAIWNVLECPVCFDMVLPPIYQCKEGHHACLTCWKKMKLCPICTGPRSRKRNYFAQALIEEIPLPCKYRVEGCLEIVRYDSKLRHEVTCLFRICQCPFNPLCDQAHSYQSMCIHLKDHHDDVLYTDDHVGKGGNFHVVVFKESLNFTHAFQIKQWGLFSLQKVPTGDLTACFIQVMFATTDQVEYNYSIEVCDHHETRKEYFKGRVFPVSRRTEKTIDEKQCLILSDLILKTIKNKSPVKIDIRIWEEVPVM